jgi:ABC-type phosphate transport system substrate-binding protein
MFYKKKAGVWLVWAVGAALFLSSVLCPDMAQAEVAVIVNPSVPINSVSSDDLKKIFTGKMVVWEGGQSIKPATLNDGSVHEEFVKNYTGKTTNQFQTYWRRMIFTGQGIQPRSFSSSRDLIEYVSETPGAIGYVSPSDISADLKKLNVSGKE